MIYESFIKDSNKLVQLRSALSILNQINAFGLLLDIASMRNKPVPSTDQVENYALRAAWQDGYVEAIRDLFYFFDRHQPKEGLPLRMNFGAAEQLLNSGTIDEKEYGKLTNPDS